MVNLSQNIKCLHIFIENCFFFVYPRPQKMGLIFMFHFSCSYKKRCFLCILILKSGFNKEHQTVHWQLGRGRLVISQREMLLPKFKGSATTIWSNLFFLLKISSYRETIFNYSCKGKNKKNSTISTTIINYLPSLKSDCSFVA